TQIWTETCMTASSREPDHRFERLVILRHSLEYQAVKFARACSHTGFRPYLRTYEAGKFDFSRKTSRNKGAALEFAAWDRKHRAPVSYADCALMPLIMSTIPYNLCLI